MIDSLEIFDSWEFVRKARKAKGLENWSRLQHVAHKLNGKKSSDISFTTAYPGKEGQTKVLGSVEGNLHFLMGYGNPGFHLASYHWQIMDPHLDDDAAEELHRVRGHPSRPEFWKNAGLEDKAEGDLTEGMPHPSAIAVQEQVKRESEGIRVTSGSGVYLAVPSEGLVYGEHNDHIYKWDVVKDSFMAATNPKLYEAMEEAAEEERTEKSYGPVIPDLVKHRVSESESFDEDVYPLIKTLFPSPGSVVLLDTHTGEVIYGVISKSSIAFYDKIGQVANIQAYDRLYSVFDLRKSGDIHPSILHNFALHYLGLDKETLEQTATPYYEIKRAPFVVKGDPSPGFENVSAEVDAIEVLHKSVVVEGNTYRLIIQEPNE
jgi:hypothetical protein